MKKNNVVKALTEIKTLAEKAIDGLDGIYPLKTNADITDEINRIVGELDNIGMLEKDGAERLAEVLDNDVPEPLPDDDCDHDWHSVNDMARFVRITTCEICGKEKESD